MKRKKQRRLEDLGDGIGRLSKSEVETKGVDSRQSLLVDGDRATSITVGGKVSAEDLVGRYEQLVRHLSLSLAQALNEQQKLVRELEALRLELHQQVEDQRRREAMQPTSVLPGVQEVLPQRPAIVHLFAARAWRRLWPFRPYWK